MTHKNNPFSPGSLICAYLRDSGGDDQDLSVPQQEASIRAWCEEHGLVLATTFADVAAPGSTIVGRAAFLRMIQHFRAPGCVEIGLVLWKFSRFARDIDDAQFYKADLRRMGYIIHSITDDIPPGVDGRFFEAARDWMNEKFLQDLSEDVKRGLNHLVQTYGAVPGTPPTGFIRIPLEIGKRRDGSAHIVHRWVPDPELITRVQKAWQMRARHATNQQIHAAVHLCGSLNSYTGMFRNPIYHGELHYAGLVIPNYCESIVNDEIWNQVQAMNKKRPTTSAPRRVTSRYLLSGLVHCARCGSPMNGHTIHFKKRDQTYDYYRCDRSHRRRDCDAQPVPRQALEDLVLASIPGDVLNPDVIAKHEDEIRRQQATEADLVTAERGELSKRLAHVSRRLSNVLNTIAELGGTPALVAKLKTMESEQAEIKNALADLSRPRASYELTADQINAQSARIRDLAAARPDRQDELQAILRGLIHRVSVEREGRASLRGLVTCYHPPEVMNQDGIYVYGVCPHGVATYRHKYTYPISMQLIDNRFKRPAIPLA